MEKQKETVSDSKGRPHRSFLKAALWAVKISLAYNVLLILIAVTLGSFFYYRPLKLADRLFDAATPGFALWNTLFGGPWHNSLVWFFSSLALNVIVYFSLAFIIKILFMAWRR